MADWNRNGKRDHFDDFMDQEIMDEASEDSGSSAPKSSEGCLFFTFTGVICFILLSWLLGMFLNPFLATVLAIPLTVLAYSWDKKLGKWDDK